MSNTTLIDQESAVEPARSSLGGLGLDVLVLIVEYLEKSDVASLRLVNSYLYKISKYGFYADTSFNFMDGVETLSQRLLSLEQHGCLPSVRSVKIADVRQRVVHLPREVLHRQQRNDDAVSVGELIQLLWR